MKGDTPSTVLFEIAMLLVTEDLRKAEPEVFQPWLADDVAMAEGSGGRSAVGAPRSGSRILPGASAEHFVVCQESHMDQVRRTLERFDFQ